MSHSLKSNKAYSLLELAAAIAIIAIIAGMAYPIMSTYLIKAKVADAMHAAGPLQAAVVNKIADIETVTDSGVGIVVPADLGRYTQSAVVSDDGVITITMNASAGSIQFTLTPSYNSSTEQVSWVCAVTNADYNSSVPTECRI